MQTEPLAVQYVRLAREMKRRCPDAQLRTISGPYRIIFRWEQQLSDDNTMVWNREIKNRYQWHALLQEMAAVSKADKEQDDDAPPAAQD